MKKPKRRPRLRALKTLAAGGALGSSTVRYIIAATPAGEPGDITLSASHADIGDELTITGSGFGSSRGSNHVYFGEPENVQGWRPVTKEAASYVSWADTSIVVTVPSMSPGKAGAAGTYHNVRVEIDGVDKGPADFFIDPVSTNPVISVPDGNITRTANETGGYDYVSSASGGVVHNGSMQDVLFDGCTFTATSGTINGANAGVVTITSYYGQHGRITYLNCTFHNNLGAGGGSSGAGVNGVKVSSWNGSTNDLSFVGCSFGTPNSPNGAFGRMGYEQVEDYGVTPALYVAIIDCTFEPVGGECVSFNAGDCYGLTSGCIFKGFGSMVVPYYSWEGSGCWETNRGRYHEIRDCEFWAGYGPPMNISEPADTTPRHILFTGCIFDHTHVFMASQASMGGWGMMGGGTNGDVLDCYINTGTASSHFRNGFILYNNGQSTMSGLRYTGSVITGYVDNGLPTQPIQYCLNENSGTDNTLPTIVDYSAYPHTNDPNYP